MPLSAPSRASSAPRRSDRRGPAHDGARCSGSGTGSTGTTSPRSPTSRARRPPPTPPSTCTRPSTEPARTTMSTAAQERSRPTWRDRAAPPSGRSRSPSRAAPARRSSREQRRAILLGTLYALGHALVVAVLGLLALAVREPAARLGRSDHGPRRRHHPDRARGLGLLLRLRLRPARDGIPAAQPLDAGVQLGALRVALVPREAPRARSRRAGRGELLRAADGVRRRDDPRHRRRDRHPGADHQRHRRRGRRRPRDPDDDRVHRRPADLEHGDRRADGDRLRREPAPPADLPRRSASLAGIFSLVVGVLFLFEADATLPDLGSIFGFIGGGG